jgi:hypothetical protein
MMLPTAWEVDPPIRMPSHLLSRDPGDLGDDAVLDRGVAALGLQRAFLLLVVAGTLFTHTPGPPPSRFRVMLEHLAARWVDSNVIGAIALRISPGPLDFRESPSTHSGEQTSNSPASGKKCRVERELPGRVPGCPTKTTGVPDKLLSLKVLQNGVFRVTFWRLFVFVYLVNVMLLNNNYRENGEDNPWGPIASS